MMVTFVSQCNKKALNRSRRVLDSFADRIGDNTWQTVITHEGLLAVKKLLRKSASKNTAVSCHWIRSRARSELVWIVGNRDKFNIQGQVPVNATKRDLIHSAWESQWVHASTIQIVATLAALLHDIGKATIGFQKKLQGTGEKGADPFRHEWISLRLFEAMVANCDDDRTWLDRFENFDQFLVENPNWANNIKDDRKTDSKGFAALPPLAQLVAWLIVTHHRLPFYDENYYKSSVRSHLQTKSSLLKPDIARFYKNLRPVDAWVMNKQSCNERSDGCDFWTFKAQVVHSSSWQKAVRRWARKALDCIPLMELSKQTIEDPLIMHLARLCLMVGDHNYSSLAPDDRRRLSGDKGLKPILTANTDYKTKQPKQALDEHLLGVASFSARFAKLLPQFSREFPALIGHMPFSKRTSHTSYKWQNNAFDAVKKHQKQATTDGFFGVNMASTGCGKTLANARIMAALADPEKGVRFTIALGLRVLTLQTGLALREKLQLDDTSLAVLVGGAADRRLFYAAAEQLEGQDIDAQAGSESAAELVKEIVNYDECAIDSDDLGTIIADPKARDLLYAPIVSCTVDHIIGATETTRGGRHISPMLRLLSSDLVLDEPDDFDQADLPALARLVYMAGMLGSKVLLSSATLTPDLVGGLYEAYCAGRHIWNQHNNFLSKNIVCAWIDEFNQQIINCSDRTGFQHNHDRFIGKRVSKLEDQPPRRRANILPVELPPPGENQKVDNYALANLLMGAANKLHLAHHNIQPDTNKAVSIGLIRLANIQPMVELAKAFYLCEPPAGTTVHLCCYHARQLLVLRNALETRLDRILNRKVEDSLFDHEEVCSAIKRNPSKNHIFIIMATAVAEVGRDHDYDWAIVEPSSMRSIIQLVGRVWRHRPQKVALAANVLILEKNIKTAASSNNHAVGTPVFTQPGFESDRHLLATHLASVLITKEQLANVNAIARIQRPADFLPKERLADLEHAVMESLFSDSNINYVNTQWIRNSASHANVHLQRISPFRWQDRKQQEYICFPDEAYDRGYRFRYSENVWADINAADSVESVISYSEFIPPKTPVKPWLVSHVATALEGLCSVLDDGNLQRVARGFASVSLEDESSGWNFHPWIGFWKR